MYKVEQINEDTIKLTKLNINNNEYDIREWRYFIS